MDVFKHFTILGIILIILGVILVALPLISRYIPSLEKLPWIIVWVYRQNGFYFATSPILIIVSIISVIIHLVTRAKVS